MTDAEILYRLIDALLRKDTEQDGNWGHMTFHEELRLLKEIVKKRTNHAKAVV